MQFYEKLDFLMKISNTTNSALSLYVCLDASHISRLRRGKRSAVKDKNSLRLMADYFSRHFVDDYQRKALAEMLDVDFLSLDTNNSSELILRWLIDDKKEESKTIETLLTKLFNISTPVKAPAMINLPSIDFPKSDTEIYYGLDGKRLAVGYFLSEVLIQEQSQTLLLYSDEPTDWMSADREFAAKWTALMGQVLSKGNRIKIIHTVSRDLDEMLHAISQWMPLYMSGLIEPYYYPKKRDGVFKRTIFIAPNTSAVISSSTGDMINKAANFYIKNKAAIGALMEEFYQYISLCSPLMKIFTLNEREAYINTLLEFEKEKGNCIIISESISLLTMPEAVASSVIPRIMNTRIDFTELAKKRMVNFQKQLEFSSFTEIIRMHNVEKIVNGEIKIASSDILNGEATYYTLEEYIIHLENLWTLQNNYQGFNVLLTEEPIESRYMIYVKENLGAIIAKTSAPYVVLAFNESNLTAGFWDYLKSLIGNKSYRYPDKKENSDKLIEYINRLRQDK